MKNGQCPKCSSREIYLSNDRSVIGDGLSIQVLLAETLLIGR